MVDETVKTDPNAIIEKHFVDLDPMDDLECPWITGFDILIKQQRMTALSERVLNLRDYIFHYRGLYALTVGQFVNFWSYYDGFLRKTEVSTKQDKVLFKCNWRNCPAKYSITLFEPHQFVLLECFHEHYHSPMDSVHQLPLCTIIRYQVLDAITKNNYPATSVVISSLNQIEPSLKLRVGLDRVDASYIEQLTSRLAQSKRMSDGPESISKRMRA